jgi:DNA-binding transcriptional LysR family regulator
MLGNLETLLVLAETGSMTRAATRLRVSQSAVSKRIDALEHELRDMLVKRGRRGVTLTARGQELALRARPLLAELKRSLDQRPGPARIALGVSESLLASWAPRLLQAALSAVPGLELGLGAHRSPVAVDLVRAGEYDLALAAGGPELSRDLLGEELGREPMLLIGRSRPRLRRGQTLAVWSIEPASATWRALEPGLQTLARERAIKLEVSRTLQSFPAVVQLARAGFAFGLVPLGIARAMGVPKQCMVALPGLARPITVFGRKTAFQRAEVTAFVKALREHFAPLP